MWHGTPAVAQHKYPHRRPPTSKWYRLPWSAPPNIARVVGLGVSYDSAAQREGIHTSFPSHVFPCFFRMSCPPPFLTFLFICCMFFTVVCIFYQCFVCACVCLVFKMKVRFWLLLASGDKSCDRIGSVCCVTLTYHRSITRAFHHNEHDTELGRQSIVSPCCGHCSFF